MKKIITLDNDLQFEVDVDDSQAQEISSYSRINKSLDQLSILSKKIVTPISQIFTQLQEEASVSDATVKIGIKVGVEGNFFIASSNAEASITLNIKMRGGK